MHVKQRLEVKSVAKWLFIFSKTDSKKSKEQIKELWASESIENKELKPQPHHTKVPYKKKMCI